MIYKITLYTITIITAIVMMTSCTTDPNSPGIEYMPDMYRSPAIEAYVDCGEDPYYVTEEVAAEQRSTMSARKPALGSIAFKGDDKAFGLPYAYANTPDGYELAGVELRSPLPISAANIEAGASNFELMCSHCHGLEGKGDGAISRNGHIMGIPDFSIKLKDLPEGKMYHTLIYGKGLMGSHSSQISQKGLWQIIQYVQVLQKGGQMPIFDSNGVALVTETENND